MRTVLGIILGIGAWFVIVLGVSFVIKVVDPGLDTALLVHVTTTAMVERLIIGFAGTIVAGYVAALVNGENGRAPLIVGVLLLAFWGYYHVTMIWNQFPIWYHLTFFASLPLLSVLGGRLAGPRPSSMRGPEN
jgi:hypothetical protein